MNRRYFLKAGLYGAAAASSLGMGFPVSTAWGSHGGSSFQRTLVDIMLFGGADFRYAIVPTPDYDADYVDQFWNSRKALYKQGYPDYASMYAGQYQTVTDPGTGFSIGIHNSCGWLASQFNSGNVAIVSNVFGSLNRRHDHSQIIVNAGDVTASLFEPDRDGWGGRLVEAVNETSNVVAVSTNVSLFCKGSNPGDRLAQVVHGNDMRNLGLPSVNSATSVLSQKNIMARALAAYYQGRSIEVSSEKPADWPYHPYFQHFSSLQSIGASVETRLSDHPVPAPLANLQLNRPSFALQCRNLYDVFLTADILDSRVISMDYPDWDSHQEQQDQLGANFSDVLGSGGGLDVLTAQLEQDLPGANESLVYVLTTDFGRQLAANGSLGTDHGRGGCMVMIGEEVNGGIHGDIFPQREAIADPADSLGRTPFEIAGSDIEGLTSFDRVLARACDWTAPGTGSVVFPAASSSALESGVDLSGLFLT